MSQTTGSNTFFKAILIFFVAAVMLTIIADVWIQWPALFLAILVSSWAGQAMSSKKKKKGRT